MKKWMAILSAAAILLTAAGCGQETGEATAAIPGNPAITAKQQEKSSPPATVSEAVPDVETPHILIAYFT